MVESELPVAAYTRGVFTRAEALTAGWTPRSIRTRLAHKQWLEVARGRYVVTLTWQVAHPTQRHRLRAIAQALGRRIVLFGPSAAAVHGFALIRPPQSRVFALSFGELSRDQVTQVSDVCVTIPTRTVLDTARIAGVEAGVVAADSALRIGAVTKAALEDELLVCKRWPGRRAAEKMIAEADGRAETPLESVSRFRLVRLGIPRPELQVEVRIASGLLYRFDFLWGEQRTVGESDGMTKYADAETLRAEKRRQLHVEDSELEVVRWCWDEIWQTPAVVAARVFRGFDRARKRYGC